MFTYTAFGLGIQSEIEIPEFRLSDQNPDVYVNFGKISHPHYIDNDIARVIEPRGNGILLYWRTLGTFLVQEGKTVTISPLPRADERLIRLVLTGAALGIILHQRGFNVFHSSLVSDPRNDCAISFMARKGEGKSTMAAAMYNAGYHMVSDDLMAVFYNGNKAFVQSGFPHTKLWSESAEKLVTGAHALPKLGPDFDKRSRPIKEGFASGPTALKKIFVLKFGDAVYIERVTGKEAFKEILPHWYGALFRGQLMDLFGRNRYFFECVKLVESVPMYVLTRPRNFDSLDETVTIIDNCVRKS